MAQEGEEVGITRVTLDVLKPREVRIEDLALALGEVEGVDSVDITVTEVDARTETLKVTISGRGVSLEEVENVMNKYSTIIRSIDAVTVGRIKQA